MRATRDMNREREPERERQTNRETDRETEREREEEGRKCRVKYSKFSILINRQKIYIAESLG